MIVKMLTHIHLVVLAHLQRRLGFGAFGKMKCLFSIAPDANSWWLALWSKDEEVRSENELVAKMLASVN